MKTFLSFQGKARTAKVAFASLEDIASIQRWRDRPRGQPESALADAEELGTLACKWWRYYRRRGEFADNLLQLRRVLRRRPDAEVSMMFVVRARCPGVVGALGACHFRRTWAGNIAVDFLAANPAALGLVGGVGRALLHQVACVADTLGAGRIWRECTPRSHAFYQHVFPRCELADTFVVSRAAYRDFIHECEGRSRAK